MGKKSINDFYEEFTITTIHLEGAREKLYNEVNLYLAQLIKSRAFFGLESMVNEYHLRYPLIEGHQYTPKLGYLVNIKKDNILICLGGNDFEIWNLTINNFNIPGMVHLLEKLDGELLTFSFGLKELTDKSISLGLLESQYDDIRVVNQYGVENAQHPFLRDVVYGIDVASGSGSGVIERL